MPIELWLAFVAASAVLLVIPGPTILTVISYSVSHGRRANVPLVAAVALGDSTALLVSLLGLGALLATSAFWFTVVKSVGGLYLIYLGIKLLRAGVTASELAAPAAPASRWRLFANTWLVTAL
ncbi:MAG: LysE family translocator, partial [Comamonadaceae bacterium]